MKSFEFSSAERRAGLSWSLNPLRNQSIFMLDEVEAQYKEEWRSR